MIILGIGIGPALPIFNLAIQNAVKPHEIGAATSSTLFFRQIGSTVGIAIFGTILATVLAARLTVSMPQELRGGSIGAATFSMGQLESGNLTSVGDQIKAGIDDSYNKIEAALTKDDASARASLLANPQLPAEMKAMLQSGGIAGQVKAGMDAQYQEISAALMSGKTAAVKALVDDPNLPAPLKDQLGRIPAAALGSPQGVKQILAAIRQGMDAQLPAITAQATQAALAQIRTAMDRQAVTLTDGVTTALKKSLTEAILRVYFWGIFVVIAGLLVTVFLPEIALRKTIGHAAPVEGVPPSGAESVEGSMAANVAPAVPASAEK
jgi:hypothetical protein